MLACIVVAMTGSGRSVAVPETHEPASPAEANDRLDIELEAAYRWAAHLTSGRAVVDVGCGSGKGAAVLAERAASVVGVAWDPADAEAGSRRHGDRVRFVAGKPDALNVPAHSFDAATCFGALDRPTDYEEILAELKRVLTDGGLLIASLPVGDGVAQTSAPVAPVNGPSAMVKRPDTSRPSRSQWQSMLEGQFQNVSLRSRRIGIAVSITPNGSNAPAEEAIEDATTVPGEPEESRVLMALASDGELPDPPATALITGLTELTAFLERLRKWEERARRAEAEGSAKHWELVAAREAQRRLRKRLHQLEHRPLRVLSRVVRGKPARLGPGPKLRLSELPKDWD